jgi:hypothetical protein
MKNLITLLLITTGLTLTAQSRGKAKMMPVFASGYYINAKNDTVRGQVQVNPEDKTGFYRQFAFKLPREKKAKLYAAQRIKAYGFDGRDFVKIGYNGENIFAERLVTGRLRFYEYQFNGKINGSPGIESWYFVKDTGADEPDLKEAKKISTTYYKRSLKPYMKDQAMLWSDLDKFTFDKNTVVRTLAEFNQFYASVAN